MIGDDLSSRRCDPKPKCLLAAGDQRCRYFEECVAPMADMVTDPARSKAITEAVSLYRSERGLNMARFRKCPDCGGPIPKSKQVCPVCSRKRRQDAYLRYNSKRGVSHTTEVQKNTLKTPIKTGLFSGVYQNAIEGNHHPQNGQTSVVKMEGCS